MAVSLPNRGTSSIGSLSLSLYAIDHFGLLLSSNNVYSLYLHASFKMKNNKEREGQLQKRERRRDRVRYLNSRYTFGGFRSPVLNLCPFSSLFFLALSHYLTLPCRFFFSFSSLVSHFVFLIPFRFFLSFSDFLFSIYFILEYFLSPPPFLLVHYLFCFTLSLSLSLRYLATHFDSLSLSSFSLPCLVCRVAACLL